MVNSLSRFVVIIWAFVVFILSSTYTASLSSAFTVQRLQPTVTQLKDLIRRGDRVGYLTDSFTEGLLKSLKVDPSKLVPYNSAEEYADALNMGSQHGGVSAIVDETPYIRVFLRKYCGKYTMVGPISKTDGFGFVFPKGSPLVPEVSKAILNLTEGEQFKQLEKELYGEDTCPDQSNDIGSHSLGIDAFWGLFLITGVASISALILSSVFFLFENRHALSTLGSSENSLLQKLLALVRLYDHQGSSSHAFQKHANRDGHMRSDEVTGGPPCLVDQQSQRPSSVSGQTYGDTDADEGIETPLEGEETPGRDIASQTPDPPSFAEMLNMRS